MSEGHDVRRVATALAVLVVLVGSVIVVMLSHSGQQPQGPVSPPLAEPGASPLQGARETIASSLPQVVQRASPGEVEVLTRVGLVVNTTEQLQRILALAVAQQPPIAVFVDQAGRVATIVPVATPTPIMQQVAGKTVEAVVGQPVAAAGGTVYSVTNVQVWGIDEPDIVKTNGTHVFVAVPAKGLVYIVSPLPPDSMSLVGVVNATSFVYEKAGPTVITVKTGNWTMTHRVWPQVSIQGLHVLGDGRLVVLVREDRYTVSVEPQRGMPAAPLLVTETYTWVIVYQGTRPEWYVRLTGHLVDTRLYNDTLVVVAGQRVRDNRTLPLVNDNPVALGRVVVTGLPAEYYTTVLLIDLDTGRYNAYSLLGPRPKLVYMSADWSLYVVQEASVYRIVRLLGVLREGTGSSTATVPPLPQPLPPPATTVIIKLGVDPETLSITEAGRISVEGLVRKQWQLDEYNGTVRLAVEEFSRDPATGRMGVRVAVYIYNATTMEKLSSLEVRLDENIHGVRFLGDRLYIVTFRRVDPLFAIDLSDPHRPRIIGYLEGPGFDEYLHPLNKTALIGIGMEDGYIRVSTYKVHGNGSIELVSRIRLSRGYTVLFEPRMGHRAFVLDPVHNLILFPAAVFEAKTRTGIMVVGFDPKTLELSPKGLLVHENAIRALFIDDAIYSISFRSIRSYSALSLKQLGELVFPTGGG